jgi:hypothetical protein
VSRTGGNAGEAELRGAVKLIEVMVLLSGYPGILYRVDPAHSDFGVKVVVARVRISCVVS